MSHRYGVVLAKVEDNQDPNGEGRVRVSFPWISGEGGDEPTGEAQGFWAPVATFMSGPDRGAWFMPEVGDEVLVAFNQGDVEHPYIVGFLWNGEQPPPETDPRIRRFRSVNGHELVFEDTPPAQGDRGKVTLQDAHGNKVELSNGRITLTAIAQIEITAPSVVINGRPVALAPRPI